MARQSEAPGAAGVALGALTTLVASVVALYVVRIYLSLLTSFGGGDAADPSWVDRLLRLGPPAVVVALVFGMVFGFARASGRGSRALRGGDPGSAERADRSAGRGDRAGLGRRPAGPALAGPVDRRHCTGRARRPKGRGYAPYTSGT